MRDQNIGGEFAVDTKSRGAPLRLSLLSALIAACALLVSGCENNGSWQDVGELELVGIHTALLPNGQVLAFGYKDRNRFKYEEGRYQLWDSATRAPVSASVVIDDWNPFCAGQAFLGDGRLFIGGGFKFGGPAIASSADRVSTVAVTAGGPPIWRRDFGKMEDLRWYPSIVTLANGDALIIGGSAPFAADNWKDTNEDYEYFSVANDYLVRHNETQRSFPRDEAFPYPDGDPRQKVADGERLAGLYPLTHVLPAASGSDAPDGVLFVLTESFLRLYNPTTNQILGPKIDVGGFRTWWTQGSSVLLPIDIDEEGQGPDEVQVLVVGGGTLGRQDRTAPALGNAEIWRYNVATRTIVLENTIALQRNRVMGDSILLPDGNVILVGGAEIGYTNENSRRVRYAELIRPPGPGFSGDTVELAESSYLRGYHASALLLPDASVFVTGGNGNWANAPVNEFKSVEIFEPPYLSVGSRPSIVEAPTRLLRGQSFAVEVQGEPEPVVVLVRNGSRTHSLDTDQRMLRLQARRSSVGGVSQLIATLPENPTYAPPGPYMLFVLQRATGAGDSPQNLIPSEAHHILLSHHVDRPDTLVSSIRLTFRTGGDDLRGGGDDAFSSLTSIDGRVVVPEFDLNGGALWDNNTVHTLTRALSPAVQLSDLRKLVLRTTFGGGGGGDNWNVDRVIIEVDTGAGWQTLYDKSRAPLARMTGERPTWIELL